MKLVNINYKGRIRNYKEIVNNLNFTRRPCQFVHRGNGFTLIIFKTGTCRLMGCKTSTPPLHLDYPVILEKIQSITVTCELTTSVNLIRLAGKVDCIFEPELFPGLRVMQFKPLCVNVFASGKITLLDLKTLDYSSHVSYILDYINTALI